jgi:hypothetical protein
MPVPKAVWVVGHKADTGDEELKARFPIMAEHSTFESATQAGRATGIHNSRISRAATFNEANGVESAHAGGLVFAFFPLDQPRADNIRSAQRAKALMEEKIAACERINRELVETMEAESKERWAECQRKLDMHEKSIQVSLREIEYLDSAFARLEKTADTKARHIFDEAELERCEKEIEILETELINETARANCNEKNAISLGAKLKRTLAAIEYLKAE